MKTPTKASVLQFLFNFTFFVYMLMLLHVTLFKYRSLPDLLFSSEPSLHTYGLNLIPFAGNGHDSQFKRQLFLNCLMYFPLGFLVSMKAITKKRCALYLLIPFGVSLLSEALQYIFHLGVADTTDLIMNTLGGSIGFACYAFAAYLFRKKWDKLDIVLIICMSCLAVFESGSYLVSNWHVLQTLFPK